MSKLKVEEVKKLTMEHFGIKDPKEVEFITEEYLNLDYQEVDENEDRYEWDESSKRLLTSYYGHNISYDGNYYYFLHGGGSYQNACGHTYSAKAPFNLWTHQNTGKQCSHGGNAHSQIALIRMR
ncbi:MAG: hypothetical protein IPN54_16990 [Bacteroidetes bacterium]|nr:hypothetical protein [Bacteroidota bacterium]MBK9425786.1 hypothetical protein [Bacteroidota bacterium]